MNLFNKLFGRNGKELVAIDSEKPENIISKELFIDENPPIKKKEENPLNKFLDFDYQTKGYDDAYRYHTSDCLEQNIKMIKSSFIMIIKNLVDKNSQELFQIKDEKLNSSGISDKVTQRLELKINEYTDIIEKLNYEIELCLLNEGLVMNAIHSYKEGFNRGMNTYLQLSVLGKSTGLFNNLSSKQC